MKKETIEEAAEKSFKYIDHKNTFIAGAKWQQEQIYNEIKELHDSEDITGFSQWTLAKCLDIIKKK